VNNLNKRRKKENIPKIWKEESKRKKN